MINTFKFLSFIIKSLFKKGLTYVVFIEIKTVWLNDYSSNVAGGYSKEELSLEQYGQRCLLERLQALTNVLDYSVICFCPETFECFSILPKED